MLNQTSTIKGVTSSSRYTRDIESASQRLLIVELGPKYDFFTLIYSSMKGGGKRLSFYILNAKEKSATMFAKCLINLKLNKI